MTAPTALVTGASRGIGLGLARHLAEQRYDLTITARDADRLDAVADELRGFGGKVDVVSADMADEDDVEGLAADITARHTALDVLVLGAGVGSAGAIHDYPMRRYDKQFAVNMRAPFLLLRQCMPLMREAARTRPKRGAKVIALASIAGSYPEAGLSAYGAAKAALISLCWSVNAEESKNGVSACAISPAYVNTDMAAWVHDRISPDEMISVSDIVALAGAVLELSPRAVVPHLVVHRAGDDLYRA